jgi:hypothetical protein
MVPRLMLVALALLALPACEGLFPSDEPRFTEATSITEPWASMNLPVQDGKVTVSGADTLTVHHAQGTTDDLGQRYADALQAAGWTKDADTSGSGVVNQTWSKEGKSLALNVLDHDGERVVSLAVLPF